jgi:putative phosphoribosyl transferase
MYDNRTEAGLLLARELKKFKDTDAVILAVPRGGVPVAYPVARELRLPLDLLLIKKLGHPFQPEYAIGAVSLTDTIIITHENVPDDYIEEATVRIRKRLNEMYHKFRGNNPPEKLKGRTVIIVDDGIATGRTLMSGILSIRKSEPAKIVIAVPVASKQAVASLAGIVDEIVCPLIPELFYGVGNFYRDFSQTTDEEVKSYLSELQTHTSHT